MSEHSTTGPDAAGVGTSTRPGTAVPAPRAAGSHPWAEVPTRPAGRHGPPVRPPASVRDAMRAWEPSRAWVHPLAAGLWVYIAGWLPSFGGFSPLVMVAVAVIATVIAVGITRRLYPAHLFGGEHRAQMLALCVIGGLLAAGWWGWAGVVGPAAPSSLAALAIGTALFVGVFAMVYKRAPIAAQVMAERVADEDRAAFAGLWNRLFAASGLAGARVAERIAHQVEDGPMSGYTLRIDGSRGADGVITAARAKEKLPKLTGLASVELAKPPHRNKIRDGALRVEASDVSHVWFLHVTTSEPLTQTVNYRAADAPAGALTDDEPQVPVGFTKLGTRWLIKLLRVHVKIVGATQSGKTTLIRRLILALLERDNVAVVVLATDKLNPLVVPFLEPWLAGRTDRPALAGVFGPRHGDFLGGLAELYRLVRLRNGDLGKAGAHLPTVEQPAVVVIIDEGQDSLPRTDTIVTHDGLTLTASELLHACTRAAASAAVVFVEAGQDGLVDAQGKRGPSIERNQTVRLCGKTMTHSDGQRTLPALRGVDTTKLTGHLWLYQGSTDDHATVEEAKVEFIGQDDIPDVVEAYTAWRPASIDSRHEPAMGPAWHGRWRSARLPEVAATAAAEGWTWPLTDDDAPAGTAVGAGPVSGASGAPLTPAERRAFDALASQVQDDQDSDQGGPEDGDDGRPAGGAFDASAALGAIQRATESFRQGGAGASSARAWERVPEPLRSVAQMLESPGAPREWVSTLALARQLRRVDDSSTAVEVDRATAKLGKELFDVAGVKSTRPRVDGVQTRGYSVTTLLDAAAGFIDPDGD